MASKPARPVSILDGNPGELLTEEHIEHAKQALKESKERVFASPSYQY